MKKTVFMKSICALVVAVLLTAVFAGCAGGIAFGSADLENATVGVYYSQSIATAESNGEEAVTYSIKEGSSLPEGLTLTGGGTISGIPAKAVEWHAFTVVAAAGNARAEASYTISVMRGKITYEDAEANVIVGVADSGTVAFATGAADITYELVGGTMPNGLTIEADGTIKGTYPRILRGRKVTVRASAADCDPAEAEIEINVVNPFLTYEGRTLADAKQGVAYAASVAYVQDSGVVAEYALKEGDTLPEGLTLEADGTITGIPATVARGEPFTVVASARGYSDTEAEFVFDVILNHVSEVEGSIVNFGGRALTEAYQENYYLNQAGVAKGVVALNNNDVVYELAAGEEQNFPRGLNLYSNGAIFGVPDAIGTYTFRVTASAQGCEAVTSEFTLEVKGARINYSQSIAAETATRGEPYSFSVATATVGEGVTITYTTDDAALAAVGLSMNSEGMISGTPTRSLKTMNFTVTASAEGYTSADCTVYLSVQEPLTAATVFEAEYTDLTGKVGTGYSGSPGEESLIERSSAASNGYFINYLHNDKITLEFVIYAEEATTAELFLTLGSELGNITLTPSSFKVFVNGTEVSYPSISLSGGVQAYNGFYENSVGTISLREGENVIQLAVQANTLKEGTTGGPGVDCIRLASGEILRWRPRVFNTEGR